GGTGLTTRTARASAPHPNPLPVKNGQRERTESVENSPMLSRTAENLYWLARYVERAEYLARTIDATLRVTALPAAYIGKTNEWESALMTAGVNVSFFEVYQEANEHNVVEYLSFNPSNSSSIKNCI